MRFSKTLLAGAAALALVSCGKKEESGEAPASSSSQQAAKTNSGSPLDASFKLKDAEAVDIDALFALMPSDARPTYDSSDFDNGLGATVVSNLRFADANDGEAVTVARAEFYGVDFDAIERVRNAEVAGDDAPFETVFEKVRLLDVASEGFDEDGEQAKISIGGIEFDKMQMRQGSAGDDDSEERDGGAHFVNAVNLAGLYFKDFKIEAAQADAPSVVMSAPDLRFVGMGGGKLGAIIANDLEYSMEQTAASRAALRTTMGPQGAMFFNGPLAGFIAPDSQVVKVETFEWRDIDFSGLLAWGLRDEEPPMTEENLLDLGTMRAANMETYVAGKKAGSVDEVSLTAAEFTWLIPSNIRIDAIGANYDYTAYIPEGEDALLTVMRDNGLDDLNSDGRMSWVWNDKTGIADLEYLADAPGLMDFSVDVGFSGLKLKDMAAAQEAGEEQPFGALGEFRAFSLKLDDEKALDAIFAIAALQMGGSGEDLRLSAPAMIRLSGAQAAMLNPRIESYVNALADFVAKGGELGITAQPAEPIGFSALQATSASAPQTLPDVIDLKVTHKE